ncbi:class I SAM-dependent methyltransferase [Acidobacteriota bacterium]
MRNTKFTTRFVMILIVMLFTLFPVSSQQGRSADDKLLDILDITEGMVVADVGAGNGKFSFKMAELVGPNGHVYANDIKVNLIDKINSRKEEDGIENLTTILSEEEDPALPAQVDLIILKFVYHHLSKPDVFMANMLKYLKPEGRLVIVAVDITQVSSSRANNASRDACVSDPDDTVEAIELNGYSFERKEFIEGSRDVDYVLFFKAAETGI